MDRRSFLAVMAAAPAVAAAGRSGLEGLPEELVKLAGGCVLAGFRGSALPGVYRELLGGGALGGVLLAEGNFAGREGLAAVARAVREASRGPEAPLLAADQEGGAVSHLSPALPRMPSMTALGSIDDVGLTQRVGSALGAGLREAGVNLDLAPVLDVRTCRANMVVYGRCFGASAELVARHGRALVEGLLAAGVLPCAKHFPGHGDTREDSHEALPRLVHGVERLAAVELVPFRAVASVVPAVMLAHVVYAGVDRLHPGTLSRAVAHGLLRETVGFSGAALSDDLEMAPVRARYGVPGAAVRALAAGCDLLVVAHTPGAVVAAVRALVVRAREEPEFRARLEEASGRVRALRRRLETPVPPNPYREDARALLREVFGRVRGRGRRYVDPTR